MFASKDLFQDDDDDSNNAQGYSANTNHPNYGNPSYYNNAQQQERDEFEDVLNDIPTYTPNTEQPNSNTYYNNNSYANMQVARTAEPNRITSTSNGPNRNADLNSILYTANTKQAPDRNYNYPQNTNKYEEDDGFVFEDDTYQSKPTTQAQQTPYNVMENSSNSIQISLIDDSRPGTSSSRPQTASTTDTKKKALEAQRQKLLDQQKKRFAQQGNVVSNDMLNKKQAGPGNFIYDVNQNNDLSGLVSNNGIFYDPSMMHKKTGNGSNLPSLAKTSDKISFQRNDDESPRSSSTKAEDADHLQQQMLLQQQQQQQAQAERKESVKEMPKQQAPQDDESEKDDDVVDQQRMADLEKRKAAEKEASKDKKEAKVEMTAIQDNKEGQTRIMLPSELEGCDIRSFLMRPCPKKVMIQCTIRRDKSGFNRFYPKYICSLSMGPTFLMVGKKRSNNKTSNYLITYNKDITNKKPPFYLGKLRSNFLGTEFNLWDNGENPKDTNDIHKVREQLGVVIYESNLLGARGPRKMKVLIPDVKPTGEVYQFKPMNNKEGMLVNLKNGRKEGLKELFNKPPKWNDQVQAFVLNFNGRVEKPSVKNFQLVDDNDDNHIYLQFGRVTDEQFNMDFQWPLSPFQAFAICLSSFDYKIACE